jgi:hypothetical protein
VTQKNAFCAHPHRVSLDTAGSKIECKLGSAMTFGKQAFTQIVANRLETCAVPHSQSMTTPAPPFAAISRLGFKPGD